MTDQPHLPPYPDVPAQYEMYAPVPAAPDGRPLASAGDRFLARLIDGVVLAVAIVLAILPFGLLAAQLPADQTALPGLFIGTAVVLGLVLLPYLYEVEYALRQGGQTVGKRVMKTTVIPMQPGAPLTRAVLSKRWAVTFLFNLLANCYIGFLDPLWLLWDKPYRQTLHDKAAATVVIKLPPR